MAAYTLHADAQSIHGDPSALERAEVLRDGFAWSALILGPLWFLWHRLWIGALVYAAAIAVLFAACQRLGVVDGTYGWAHFLLAVFFAHEANAIRSWTLRRRGRPPIDVVVADDRDSAEARLFARFLARADQPARADVAGAPMRTPGNAVLGLFPEAEAGR